MDDFHEQVATRPELFKMIDRLREELAATKRERDHLREMLKGEAIHSDLEARKRAVDAEARAEAAERALRVIEELPMEGRITIDHGYTTWRVIVGHHGEYRTGEAPSFREALAILAGEAKATERKPGPLHG